MKRLQILFLYLILLNLLGFILMGVDKRRAIRHAWRIPEAHLFRLCYPGRKPGIHPGHVYLPPQNKALVLCLWYASHPSHSDNSRYINSP